MNEQARRIQASRSQERRGARTFEGKIHRGSGNFWARKGDVSNRHELIEFKRTDKKQITIKAEDLEKICDEALIDSRIAVLVFEINGKSYVILEETDYLEMTRGGLEEEG